MSTTSNSREISNSDWFENALNTSEHIDNNDWPHHDGIDPVGSNDLNETLADILGQNSSDFLVGNGEDIFGGTTLAPMSSPTSASMQEQNVVIVGVLIGLIVILCIVLGCVTVPPVCACVRRKLPVSKRRIDRRYATIDGWLITKPVKPHDEMCERVQRQYGVKGQMADSVNTRSKKKSLTTKSSTLSTTIATASSGLSDTTEITLTSSPHRNEVKHRIQDKDEEDECESVSERDIGSCTCTLDDKKECGYCCIQSFKMEDLDVEIESLIRTDCEASANHEAPSKTPNYNMAESERQALESVPCPSSSSSSSHAGSSASSASSFSRPFCPICFEVFQVGEAVSWSSSVKCDHVFHHPCIKEWLLRRVGCPCCRETFLPVDRMIDLSPASFNTNIAATITTLQGTANQNAELDVPDGNGTTATSNNVNDRRRRNRSTSDRNLFSTFFRFQGSRRHQALQEQTNRRLVARRRGRLRAQILQSMSKERSERAASTYFCAQDGLVTLRVAMHQDTGKGKKKDARKKKKQSRDEKDVKTLDRVASDKNVNGSNNSINSDSPRKTSTPTATQTTTGSARNISSLGSATRRGPTYAGRWFATLLLSQTRGRISRTQSNATSSPDVTSGDENLVIEPQASNLQLGSDQSTLEVSQPSNGNRLDTHDALQMLHQNDTFLEDESSCETPPEEESEDIVFASGAELEEEMASVEDCSSILSSPSLISLETGDTHGNLDLMASNFDIEVQADCEILHGLIEYRNEKRKEDRFGNDGSFVDIQGSMADHAMDCELGLRSNRGGGSSCDIVNGGSNDSHDDDSSSTVTA